MKELLDAVLELIGFFPPDVFDPRPIMHQRAVLHRGLELGVIEAIEFESEKQEVRRGGGDALLHVGVEFAARGIGGVASVDQPGKGREPPKKVDRKSTRLNSSHRTISYAVLCLKKKTRADRLAMVVRHYDGAGVEDDTGQAGVTRVAL